MLDWTPVERVLLNLVIASTVLPLLVIGVAWFRRPGNAASRAFLWQSIFPAVLLAAIAGMSPIGLKLPVQSLSPLEPDNLALTDGLSKRYSQRNADVTLPAAVSKASVDASLNHRTNARVSDNQLAVPAAKAKSESMNRPASWPANLSTLDWSMIATAIWMLGMLWLLVRLMNGIRMARLIRRQAAPAPVSLQQLSCDVTLLLSDDMNSPAVIGFIRPAILMPTEATNWTSEELRMAIEHERAHVMRYDLQWQLVGQLTLAATWFQPLMWWVLRRYQRERELACDDAVLLRGHQPIRFAEMLARRSCDWPQQLIPSATIGMAEPPLKARLRSILSDTLERDCQLNVTAKRFAVAMILITVISGLLRPATLVAQTPTNSQADDILAELPSKTTGMAAVQGGEGTLTVTVVDQRGLPVAGVRPIPIQWVGRYRHTGMAQLTDDAGVTMITRLPTKRQLTVFLKKDGYAMGALSLRFAKPTARRLTCILDRPAKGWIDLRD
ncbi:MAG: M56 family metallopeptidase, partial [Planctomycetota bacterium]